MLENCSLKRKGTLLFDFKLGSCAVMFTSESAFNEETVYLCFGNDNKDTCRDYPRSDGSSSPTDPKPYFISRLVRIGSKIPESSYNTISQSKHRHYLTRVASYNENIFALGDYDDEHNHAEIYDPIRKVFKRSSEEIVVGLI